MSVLCGKSDTTALRSDLVMYCHWMVSLLLEHQVVYTQAEVVYLEAGVHARAMCA